MEDKDVKLLARPVDRAYKHFKSFYLLEEFCDLHLHCCYSTVKCHTFVLSTVSKFFQSVLNSADSDENGVRHVILGDISDKKLVSFVDSVYEGLASSDDFEQQMVFEADQTVGDAFGLETFDVKVEQPDEIVAVDPLDYLDQEHANPVYNHKRCRKDTVGEVDVEWVHVGTFLTHESTRFIAQSLRNLWQQAGHCDDGSLIYICRQGCRGKCPSTLRLLDLDLYESTKGHVQDSKLKKHCRVKSVGFSWINMWTFQNHAQAMDMIEADDMWAASDFQLETHEGGHLVIYQCKLEKQCRALLQLLYGSNGANVYVYDHVGHSHKKMKTLSTSMGIVRDLGPKPRMPREERNRKLAEAFPVNLPKLQSIICHSVKEAFPSRCYFQCDSFVRDYSLPEGFDCAVLLGIQYTSTNVIRGISMLTTEPLNNTSCTKRAIANFLLLAKISFGIAPVDLIAAMQKMKAGDAKPSVSSDDDDVVQDHVILFNVENQILRGRFARPMLCPLEFPEETLLSIDCVQKLNAIDIDDYWITTWDAKRKSFKAQPLLRLCEGCDVEVLCVVLFTLLAKLWNCSLEYIFQNEHLRSKLNAYTHLAKFKDYRDFLKRQARFCAHCHTDVVGKYWQYREHILNHFSRTYFSKDGQTPWLCEICKLSFPKEDYLNTHYLSHCDEIVDDYAIHGEKSDAVNVNQSNMETGDAVCECKSIPRILRKRKKCAKCGT